MSRSRDSLSRALDDRQHRSTLASLVISWVKGTIPFIAMYIYIFSSSHQSRLLFILAVWHHLQHQLILPFFRAWSFYRYFSLSFSLFLYFRGNIRGAIYLSTRSLKISPRGEIVVTRHTFPLRLTTSVSNRFDPFPLPLMLLLLFARSIIFV